jgi:hypothetical protein
MGIDWHGHLLGRIPWQRVVAGFSNLSQSFIAVTSNDLDLLPNDSLT